jgi:HEPN domain-containing protein
MFKSVLAYNNQHIKKSHDLAELYALIDSILLDEIELDILDLATGFFQENRYPNAYYSLPNKNEIKKVLALANSLSVKIASLLI